jgi:hypothetical protein
MALTTTDKQLPYLALQKEPALTMQELYIKYPDGGELGWYAFVKEIGSFAYWDVESKSWKGDKALVFKEEAETARDAALQAQEDSENAKDDAVIAKGQAQEAQTAAEGFAGDAFRSMELSEQAKVAAEKAQGKSEDAQIASETAKGLSETARDQSVAARNEAVNLVSQVGLGTPKGTFTALVDLQTADPDHQYIYLVISDGHWYYWDETEEEWADGGVYQAALDVVGELGTSETKVVNQKGVTINNLKSWSLAESFSISSPTFDGNGYVSGGVITWPDGDVGSISNVTTGVHGITSIRYNRSEAGKYATVNITYDSSGVVSNQEVVLTGF